MIKTKFFNNPLNNFTPQIVKRRCSSSFYKNIELNNKFVPTRLVAFKEKRNICIEQQPQVLQFWGCIDPVQIQLPLKDHMIQQKKDKQKNISISQSQLLFQKYVERKERKLSQIKISTQRKISHHERNIQTQRKLRSKTSLKNRKHERLNSTAISINDDSQQHNKFFNFTQVLETPSNEQKKQTKDFQETFKYRTQKIISYNTEFQDIKNNNKRVLFNQERIDFKDYRKPVIQQVLKIDKINKWTIDESNEHMSNLSFRQKFIRFKKNFHKDYQ